MNLKIIIIIFIFVLTACSLKPFKVINENATNERVKEVNESLNKCSQLIDKYFNSKPSALMVYTYGDRNSFGEGLQSKIGFSEKTAEYFRKNSAPRPIKGKLLVPPDQELKNVCHEMVHHYLEANTNRANLLNAKWFDEGMASYLARLFEGKTFDGGNEWFKKEFKGAAISVDQMSSNDQWNGLHKNMKSRQEAYMESMLLINYFFENYSVDQFKQILKDMKVDSFNVSFKKVTGITPMEFYNNWKKGL